MNGPVVKVYFHKFSHKLNPAQVKKVQVARKVICRVQFFVHSLHQNSIGSTISGARRVGSKTPVRLELVSLFGKFPWVVHGLISRKPLFFFFGIPASFVLGDPPRRPQVAKIFHQGVPREL